MLDVLARKLSDAPLPLGLLELVRLPLSSSICLCICSFSSRCLLSLASKALRSFVSSDEVDSSSVEIKAGGGGGGGDLDEDLLREAHMVFESGFKAWLRCLCVPL